jgi:hypothetical protein
MSYIADCRMHVLSCMWQEPASSSGPPASCSFLLLAPLVFLLTGWQISGLFLAESNRQNAPALALQNSGFARVWALWFGTGA